MRDDFQKPVSHRVATGILLLGLLFAQGTVHAESEWFSFTLDNDTFVGNDNGYTNGVYLAWFDTPGGEKPAEAGLLASAMRWSLPRQGGANGSFSVKTLGQTMVTPEDITEDPPPLPPADLPYGGLLFFRDTLIQINQDTADAIAVTIGIVGEYSFAEDAQKIVHDLIDSDEPCCWDEQLADEVVFEFSRSRIWKTWSSDTGNADFLTGAGLTLGTLSSAAELTAMVRYGRGLKNSFASALLVSGRTINPVATRSGWYLFAGVGASYLGNQVFLDSSRSYDKDFEEIEYDNERVSVSTGIAYSWQDVSLTFAINDANISENSDNESAEEYTEYGTFTLAWKLD